MLQPPKRQPPGAINISQRSSVDTRSSLNVSGPDEATNIIQGDHGVKIGLEVGPAADARTVLYNGTLSHCPSSSSSVPSKERAWPLRLTSTLTLAAAHSGSRPA